MNVEVGKLIIYPLNEELKKDLENGKLVLKKDPEFTNNKENIVLIVENERENKSIRVQVQSFDVDTENTNENSDPSLSGSVVKDLKIERFYTTYGKTYFVAREVALKSQDGATIRIYQQAGDK